MTLNGSYASNPDFLAKSAVGLEWNGRLPDGFGYTLGAEQRQYEEATTDMYRLGVEKNAGGVSSCLYRHSLFNRR